MMIYENHFIGYKGSGNHVSGNYGDCASDCPGAGAQPTSAPTVAPADCRSIGVIGVQLKDYCFGGIWGAFCKVFLLL